MTFMLRFGLGL